MAAITRLRKGLARLVPHPVENALLDDPKQFDLDGFADFADFIQKNSAEGAASVEDAFVILHGRR